MLESAMEGLDKTALLDMLELDKKMKGKSVEDITQDDTNAMQQKTFTFLCSILPKVLESLANTNELNKQVGQLKKENIELKKEHTELKKDHTELRKEVLNQQIRLSAKSVIIRNLPQIKPGRESQFELKNQFENVLREVEISQSVMVTDIFRLKSNPGSVGKSEFLPTKVEFSSKFQKGLFMASLKHLKNYKNIQVSSDTPKLLIEQSRELEKKAYELRKAEAKTRTRVMLKGQNLALYAKREGEHHFQEVEFN